MSSAFESFVQLELPLRPYVPVDPAQESIAIRRGAGPRQLTFVELTDNQVLGKVAGTIQGVSLTDLGEKGYIATVGSALDTWTITHNRNSTDCIIQVYEASGATWKLIMANDVEITNANTITIKFGAAQAGRAHIMFFNV